MEPRFHRTDRDLEDVRDLAILQVLVVGEDQGLAEGVGQSLDAVSDSLLPFLRLELRQRPHALVDEQVEK